MNILIAGGAGFIGSHTAIELIEQGHTPIVVDTLINSVESVYDGIKSISGQDIRHYETDIRDTDALVKMLTDHDCKAVIHFAAFKAVGESVADPLKYYDTNIQGTVSVLKAMDRAGVSELIFSSSTVVYGDPDSLPITEDARVKPATNPYGATKQMCEQIITDTCKATDIRAILLRYFNPIGAHPSGLIGEQPVGTLNGLIPLLVQAVVGERAELTVFGDDYDTGDGSAIRDYIHVVDLAKAHVASLDYFAKTTDKVSVFNVGTGRGSTVLDVIHAFEKVNNLKVPYSIGPRRPGDIGACYASPDKAEKELGWKAQLTVETALKDVWNWQQSQKKS